MPCLQHQQRRTKGLVMNYKLPHVADSQAALECLYRMLDAADRKDWPAARAEFLDSVLLDHDSNTRDPRRISSGAVIESWKRAFERFDVTWNSVTNPTVEFEEECAVIRSRIHALHVDFSALGGDNQLTEWGTYRHKLVRAADGWRIAAIEYRCLYARGNRALFVHV
jgi:hypothetical protein